MMTPIPTSRALFVASLLWLAACQPQLEPGGVVEHVIRLDERQRFTLPMEKGLFYHVIAEQPTADIVLTLYDPRGERVDVDVDATTPGQRENLYFIPPENGRYVLEVHGLALSSKAEDGKGRYSLEIKAPHAPNETERLITEASWEEAKALEFDAIAEDCPSAIVHYKKAAELWEEAGRPRDVGLVLLELGDCYLQLGDSLEGHEIFLRALQAAVSVDDQIMRIQVLSSLGVTSRRLGKFNDALEYHSSALEVARGLGTSKNIARALNNLCVFHMELGQLERAKATCSEAIAIHEELGQTRQQISTLSNLGLAFFFEGELRKAIEIYERALAINRNFSRLTSTVLANQAHALADLGETKEARRLLNEALAMSIDLEEQGSEAAFRALLAHILVDLGEEEAATREAAESLALLKEVNDLEVKVTVLERAAKVSLRTGALEESVRTADRAFALIEEIRQTPRDYGERATFLASEWSLYDLRVTARMALFAKSGETQWRDSAFQAAEEARGRGLVDRLWDSQQSAVQGVGPGLLTPAEIHQLLSGEKTGLLHFHLGVEKSFLWRLAGGEIEAFFLPTETAIRQEVTDLYGSLTARERSLPGESPRNRASRVREADREVRLAGRRLASILELDKALDHESIVRWVIIPDGVLHQVPFAALSIDKAVSSGDRGEMGGGPWRPLLADFEIVYAPSASSLGALRRAASERSESMALFALADPVFQAVDPRHGKVELPEPGKRLAGPRLERLPLTREEAHAIAELAPAESVVVTDHAASKERAMAGDLASFGFLHFATHGVIDQKRPSRSALVLSRVDEYGRAVDGYLSVRELESMDLRAQLVVLSTCHSASGQEIRGEGLQGLARGFVNAGVPRVIASQWTVQDGVTRELMTSLYEKVWKEKVHPSAALRGAQLELWRRGLPAYHWAAFSFQGEWR